MTTRTRPYNVKQSDLRPEWHVVDARGKTLGRVSTEIATLLQGKHKPTYTPHLAAGDFVVVVNASKFRVSGNKLAAKMYYRHSGYHGGLTEQTLEELLEKHPTRALRQAVKGMLPKNIRGKHMLSRLKLYEGEEHPHQAQVSASRAQAAPLEAPGAPAHDRRGGAAGARARAGGGATAGRGGAAGAHARAAGGAAAGRGGRGPGAGGAGRRGGSRRGRHGRMRRTRRNWRP